MNTLYKTIKTMKIYKIAQNAQYIQQNPSGPTNPDVNLQNMQNAQAALGPLNDIRQAAGEVTAAISKLEESVGKELGISEVISVKLNEALEQNPSVSLLIQMNLLQDAKTLFNDGELDKIQTKINDMQSVKGTSGEQANTGQ
jgi:hypothetical protein